jgi:hypothetical protein
VGTVRKLAYIDLEIVRGGGIDDALCRGVEHGPGA